MSRRPQRTGQRVSGAEVPPASGALTVLTSLCLAITLTLSGLLGGRLWAHGHHATAQQWTSHVLMESLGVPEHHAAAAQVGRATGGAQSPVVRAFARAVADAGPHLFAAPTDVPSPQGTTYLLHRPEPTLPLPLTGRREPAAPRAGYAPPAPEPPDRPPRAGA